MISLSTIEQAVLADQFRNTVLDSLTDGVYFVDRNRRILYWNKAAEQLTGFTSEQVLGLSCTDGLLRHVDQAGVCLCEKGCPLTAVMEDGRPREAHVFLHHAQGHRLPVQVRGAAIIGADDEIVGSVEVFSDDSDRLDTLDRLRELEQAALIDELTELANRRYFNRAIDASLAEYTRHGTPVGILLLDIDHFKRFNDTYGHEIGDRMLKLVARTLAHNCRAFDTPVRWGGEEFAVIADRVTVEQLHATAERLRQLIAASFLEHGAERLAVTVSVGGTMVRADDNADSVLERVDNLLYQSKQAGRNRATI